MGTVSSHTLLTHRVTAHCNSIKLSEIKLKCLNWKIPKKNKAKWGQKEVFLRSFWLVEIGNHLSHQHHCHHNNYHDDDLEPRTISIGAVANKLK